MIKLYGAIASPYVARVVMYARIKGIDLPLSDAPGGIKSPEYLRLNPVGKMPALEVDGQGIGESTVICDYLEDVYTDRPGLPADAYDRARSRLVARLTDRYLAPQGSALFRQMNPAKRDAVAVDAAVKEIGKVFGWLEQVMGNGPFCVGSVPTLGDCALSTWVMMLKQILPVCPEVPDPVGQGRLADWWQAMQAHPECGVVLNDFGTAFGGFMKMMAPRR